jgi:hypothetical protein
MTYSSCPTDIVNAPVNVVWSLLTDPTGWEKVFDVRIVEIRPRGPAAVTQTVYAESGPSFLHLKVEIQFFKIDSAHYALNLNVRLPFQLMVYESLTCVPLSVEQTLVNYRCDFSLPPGWRGVFIRIALRRKFDTGPADSLRRLKRAAEERYALTRA